MLKRKIYGIVMLSVILPTILLSSFHHHHPAVEGDLPLIPAPKLTAEVKWEITHDGKVLNNNYVSLRLDRRFAQGHFLIGTETPTDAVTLI